MIKVHAIGECFETNKLGDVAYIRLYLPLQLLADDNKILLTKDYSYNNYKDSDIFIIQRTWSCNFDINEAESFIKMIYSKNKKLIYEIDDNLLDNNNISIMRKKIIHLFLKNADVVITSTEELKDRINIFNENITVIPNYLDCNLLKLHRELKKNNEVITIGYMGTFTHQSDFQMIKLPLMRILKKYQSKVKFEILGALEDESILQSIPNVFIKKRSGITDYFTFWEWMNNNCFWDIGIAPLKYCDFTKCKSDIKYLDYSALKISGVYSKHPAYINTIIDRKNGLIVENNCDAWQKALDELINDDDLRNKIKTSAHEDLCKNRLLQKNVNKWFEVINKVAQQDNSKNFIVNQAKYYEENKVKPDMSVIVPVYNAEKYLDCCIKSILSQTMDNFECLLIDDCSKDRSLEICNFYAKKDKRIKVYHKDINEGVALARKTGIEKVNTDYVIFIDNDDWIENTMFEELYNKMNSNNFDMVCCDFYHEFENEQIYSRQDPKKYNNIDLMKQVIYWGDFLPVTWNKLIRTELYKKITFSKISYSEDRGIMVQILFYTNKIGYVNKAFYHWRHIDSSLSRKKNNLQNNLYEDYICYVNIIYFIINNGLNADDYIKYIEAHIDIIGEMYSYNIKLFNIFKTSFNKIIKWHKNNILVTEELLFKEKMLIRKKIKKYI